MNEYPFVIRTKSWTDLAIGPITPGTAAWVPLSFCVANPLIGNRPLVGLNPQTPEEWALILIDPARSVAKPQGLPLTANKVPSPLEPPNFIYFIIHKLFYFFLFF